MYSNASYLIRLPYVCRNTEMCGNMGYVVNGLCIFYSAFPVCRPPKALAKITCHIHSFTHNSYTVTLQGANCSSGALWGSASCSSTLRHAATGATDSHYWTTRPTSWATAVTSAPHIFVKSHLSTSSEQPCFQLCDNLKFLFKITEVGDAWF